MVFSSRDSLRPGLMSDAVAIAPINHLGARLRNEQSAADRLVAA